MSDTTRKPLPPALKALKPILDTLSLEEGSEDETEVTDIKDFRVRVFPCGEGRRLILGLIFGQLETKVFYPKGEIQRESYHTKDGKVRALSLGRGSVSNDSYFHREYPLTTGESMT